jgi:hypothetical protein
MSFHWNHYEDVLNKVNIEEDMVIIIYENRSFYKGIK